MDFVNSLKKNKKQVKLLDKRWSICGGVLNNPDDHFQPDPVTFFEEIRERNQQCSAIFGQLEIGEEGTDHYQYGMQFAQQKSLKWLKKNICEYSNFKMWDTVEQLYQYCTKKDTRISGPWQLGNLTFVGGTQAQINKNVRQLAICTNEELGELNPQTYNATIKAIGHYNLVTQIRYKGPRTNFWLYGEPGVGKSMYVKSFCPYIKPTSKWWDGYQGQTDVLIDDFEKDAKFMAHFLKLWGDPYGELDGEIKGGTIPLNYHRLWITSSYTIREVFGVEDPMLIAAMDDVLYRLKYFYLFLWIMDQCNKEISLILIHGDMEMKHNYQKI